MAGRGMGAATKGGGCVGSGPRNKMMSEPSMKTGKVLMMAQGGMAAKGYKKGGMAKKKRKGSSCG